MAILPLAIGLAFFAIVIGLAVLVLRTQSYAAQILLDVLPVLVRSDL